MNNVTEVLEVELKEVTEQDLKLVEDKELDLATGNCGLGCKAPK